MCILLTLKMVIISLGTDVDCQNMRIVLVDDARGVQNQRTTPRRPVEYWIEITSEIEDIGFSCCTVLEKRVLASRMSPRRSTPTIATYWQ